MPKTTSPETADSMPEIEYTVECLECDVHFSPKKGSQFWDRAKRVHPGVLRIEGEECGCKPKNSNPLHLCYG